MTEHTHNKNTKPTIWTISGSDCSGGAGIAADIKTGHGLGVEVCHLITANTVQNSQKLVAVNPVSIEILQQQFEVLINDKAPLVIKVGLLVNVEQVLWLSQAIKQLKQNITELITIYDPVGQASVGGCFNSLSVAELAPLLNVIDVITPNLSEAQFLAKLAGESNVIELSNKIYQEFAINSIIIKGGHRHGYNPLSSDYCLHQLNQLKQDNQENFHQEIRYQLSSPRIESHYSHGGGCSFASALAAFLAQGYLVRDAFTLAKAFINQGFIATADISKAQQHHYYGAFEPLGWPNKQVYFPVVIDELNQQYAQLPAFNDLALPRGSVKKLGLYPVIDSLYWLKRLLPLNLNIIQLRLKNKDEQVIEHLIEEAVELCKTYNTRLFINDYWQLAIKHGAYGVHIGQEDLQNADLNAIQQAGLRLGISTHGCYEFLLAQQLKPSYLAIGAIFPTKTKDMTGQIQGLDNLQQILTLATDIPIVAIGGINQQRAAQVWQTGCDSLAVVTAITEAENPELAVKQLQSIMT